MSVFTHFCFCTFWSSTHMQLLCLFLRHLIPCFCADLVACVWWTHSLRFFQALSSVECFGLPSSCGGSPEFTFSPGPWIVWASVCLFNTLYPHYGFHVSFTLSVPLSLLLFSVPSFFTSVQLLRSDSLSFNMAHFGHSTSVSLPVGVQLPRESSKAHFLPPAHSTDYICYMEA